MMKNSAIWILKKIYNVDVNNLELQNERLSEENGRYLSTNIVLEKDKNILSEIVSIHKKERTALQEINVKLQDEINDNGRKCVKLQEKVDVLNKKLVSEKENIRVLKSQIDNDTTTIEKKDSEIKKIQVRIQQLELADKDEDLTEVNHQVQDQIENLNRQYQNLKERYDQACKDSAEFKSKFSTKDATIDILNKEIMELRNGNTRLKGLTEPVPIVKKDDDNEVPKITGISDNTIPDRIGSEGDGLLVEVTKEELKTIVVESGIMTVVESTQNTFADPYVDDTKRTIDTIVKKDDDNEVPKVTGISDNPIPDRIGSEGDGLLVEVTKEELKTIVVESGIMTVVESTQNTFADPYVDDTKRTIDTIIDLETDSEIKANDFFSQPENLIFKVRTELEKAIYLKMPKFVCKYCGQKVKISGRKTERGMAKFFSHLRDSDECDYKTTTGKAKKEINREKYARCNEGERHKRLKVEIAKYLEKTSGVSEVKTENTVIGNHPILRWRRPDVLANFMGQEIVFELQLSTTFVSVIAERDLFYRLNKKFIIWIFNFDEQEEHVNLNNMMTKDIYYNNKLNIFIFNKAAQEESEKRGELVLKCNWLKTDGSWEYLNGNSSNDLGGKFVTLSELTYDNTYKPYYFDAEQEYFAAHPEFQIKTLDIEEENKKIIKELDELWRQEQEELKTEDKLQSLVEAFELDAEVKCTQKYVIGKKEGKYGLITFDGEIRIPFEYEIVSSHRGWYEGTKNGLCDLFDKNDYSSINTGIRRIEEFNPVGAKYVKEVNGNLLWGVMTKKGVPLTSACYSKLDIWFSDKVIAVRDGLYCIIDSQGNEVLSNYDYISELKSDNTANVIYDGRNGLIDSNCQSIKTERDKFGNGLMKVCQTGRWGIEREDGTTVIPCKYDEIGSYKNGLVGLNGINFSIIDEKIDGGCPVKVEYVFRNDRKMLIFKVGKREAFMNLRQQQKAVRLGLQPIDMTEMYLSFVNPERELLYLSAIPIIGQNQQTIVKDVDIPIIPINGQNQQTIVKDVDIPIGSIWVGCIFNKNKMGIIVKTVDGQIAFLHSSTLGKHTMDEFEKGKSISIEKIGYDQAHNKNIWKITSISS